MHDKGYFISILSKDVEHKFYFLTDLKELFCTEKNEGQQAHVLVTRAARASKSE